MFVVHPMVFAAVIPWVAGMFTIVFAIYELIGSFCLAKSWIFSVGLAFNFWCADLAMGVGFSWVPEMFAMRSGLL